jgi:hypothetical protein
MVRTAMMVIRLAAVGMIIALSLCLSCGMEASPTKAYSKQEAQRILEKQGFSGVFTGKVTLTYLGNLSCNNAELGVYNYEWEGPHKNGNAVHFIERLIFISTQGRYEGHYVVEDPPSRIGPLAVFFDYLKGSGNEITCESNGLPKRVVLNDSEHVLER